MARLYGLIDIGRPQPGETVVVSAASGAVGSMVGQIARIKKCRVVGITSSAEKCRWLTEELGFDAAIDYKTTELKTALAAACPQGIDIYFENVGGKILDTVLTRPLAKVSIAAR
ncbi:MAG: zinc-binding dehydrogenase [Prochloraceae cyanobacterium]|nr:zinc-binding dehydrogenase [Prochloraceae cyanobacterium]